MFSLSVVQLTDVALSAAPHGLSPDIVGKWLAILVSTIGGAWGAWVKALRPAYRTARTFLESVVSAVALVEHELRPNGGGSIRDTVNATRSELRQVAHSQALTSAMQRTMAASVRAPMFQADAQGACTWVNDTWCRATGIDDLEAQGMGWVNGVHPDDRARVIADWEHAIDDVRAFRCDFRYRHVSTLDETRVRVEAHPVRIGEHGVAGYVGTAILLDALGREPFPAYDRRSTIAPPTH